MQVQCIISCPPVALLIVASITLPAMPALYFCTHPLHFKAPSYMYLWAPPLRLFQRYTHTWSFYTSVHSCYTTSTSFQDNDSVPSFHFHSSPRSSYTCVLPVVDAIDQYRRWSPVGIGIHHYCSPPPVRLALCTNTRVLPGSQAMPNKARTYSSLINILISHLVLCYGTAIPEILRSYQQTPWHL